MLNVNLCGVKLRNPTILASGILGVAKESVDRIGKAGAGAVTLKSLCHEERKGNANPTMFGYDDVFLNAVGLPGQGIDNAVKDFGRPESVKLLVVIDRLSKKFPVSADFVGKSIKTNSNQKVKVYMTEVDNKDCIEILDEVKSKI